MKKVDLYIGSSAPSVNKGAAWLKPVGGGFALYILDGGWKPLVLVNDNNTPSEGDDTIQDLIGSTDDAKTANTINGAKAYARDAANAVVGTDSDTPDDMTLKGLKAYVDAQIEGLG